jgi:pyruvate,water dikinase
VVCQHGVSHLVHTGEEERRQPSLTDDQLRELAAQLVRIEQFYNGPQDVEWGHDGKQFWILQSRPAKMPASPQPDIEWTRANIREVLPDLTSPQVLWAGCDFLKRAMRQYLGRLLAPEGELGPVVKKFYGRIYFNLSQLRHTCQVIGVPPALILRGMGHESGINAADEVAPRPPLVKFLVALPDILRLGWKQLNLPRLMRREEALLQQRTADLALRDPGKLADTAVWSVIQESLDTAAEKLQIIFALSGLMIYEGRLKKFCQRIGFQHERLIHTQLAVGDKSVGAQQAFDLLTLANLARREEKSREYFNLGPESFDRYREALGSTEFLKQFDAFLRLYGHRGNHESDWGLPRYYEDPTPLLAAIRTHVRAPECPNPEAIIQSQNRRAVSEWMEFVSRMNGWQRLTLIPRVRGLLRKMKRMYLWRERYRSEIVAVPLRRWHLTLAERFAARGWIQERDDYFFLTLEEIGAGMADPNQTARYRAVVAQRKAESAAWGNLEMPLLMHESELPMLIRRATANLPDIEFNELRGLCVSAGTAEGEVVVIREPTEFARMKPGAILVAPATDPSWTSLFTLASGVIVEVGGMLSHAFTVAREYGLPALGNLKDATKLLKNGDQVRLDATRGKVEIIRRFLSRPQTASYKDPDP